MNCPVCDAKLRPVEKHGVEVDICPDCKGIWLDRGELEKILQMAEVGGPAEIREPRQSDDRYTERHKDGHDDEHGRSHESETGKTRRKGSWLSDIMDSFGGGD